MNFAAQVYSAFTSELSKIADLDKVAAEGDSGHMGSGAQQMMAHPSVAGAQKLMPPKSLLAAQQKPATKLTAHMGAPASMLNASTGRSVAQKLLGILPRR
jgi:hypothetical protein